MATVVTGAVRKVGIGVEADTNRITKLGAVAFSPELELDGSADLVKTLW